MRIYLNPSNRQDYIDVVALISKVCSRGQHEKEKFLGFDFLGLIPRGDGSGKDCHICFLIDKKVKYDFGLENEKYLLKLAQNFLSDKEYIHLISFYYDNGVLKEKLVKVRNTFSGHGRSSRRYLVLFYKGKFVLSDVARLNDLTLHYKTDRSRNKRGLEWENYSNLILHGSPFR